MKKNPDHTKQISRLNRIIGQLEGVKNMIVEGAYCPDILMQTKAAKSALRSLEGLILEKHIRHCVSHAAQSRDRDEIDCKIEELIELFKKN